MKNSATPKDTPKDDRISFYLDTYEIEKLKITKKKLKQPVIVNRQSAANTTGDHNKNFELPLPPILRNHQSIKPFALQNHPKLGFTKSKVEIEELNFEELMELAILVLNKPSAIRTNSDINLLKAATANVKFFQELNETNTTNTNIHELCCKYMTYERFNANEVIFEIGSFGTKFYIILKGSVRILANINNRVITLDADGQRVEKNEVIFTEVKSCAEGDSFGELSLIEKKPRAATIITSADTDLIVFEKDDFDNILKGFEKQKFYNEINFFLSLSLFSSWALNTMKYLYYHMHKKIYQVGEYVYQEKEESNFFYIVRKGEFKMFSKYKSDNTQELKLKVNNKPNSYLNIAVLTEGCFFGEDEIIDDCSRRTTVVCHTVRGELFIIEKKEFARRFWSEDQTKEYLLNQKKIREKWKEETLQKNKMIKENYSEFIKKNHTIRTIPADRSPLSKEINDLSKINAEKANISSFDNFFNDSVTDKISTPTLLPDTNLNPYLIMEQNDIRNSTNLNMQLSSLRRQINKSSVSLSNKKNKWESINMTESVISANNSPLLPNNHPLFFNKIPISDPQSQEILRYPIHHGGSRTEDEEVLERIKKNYLLFNENNNVNARNTQNNFSSKDKDNTIETIKNGFRAKEIAKLKAFQKFEEMKDQYSQTPTAKGKQKAFIQPLLKFSVPKKFQIKIDEFKKKYKIASDRVKSFDFDDNRNQQQSKNNENGFIHKISSKLNNEMNTTSKKVINLDYINTDK